MSSFAVFVDSIVKEPQTGVWATATNGGTGGPPKIVWQLSEDEIDECHIGKKYTITIEEDVRR